MNTATAKRLLIDTPLQWGVEGGGLALTVSTVSSTLWPQPASLAASETVETVKPQPWRSCTPLKWGVNEKELPPPPAGAADGGTELPPGGSAGKWDLARWRRLPDALMVAGGLVAIAGLANDATRFGYAWLLAFMFFLSLGLGALFLVMAHHLFDASWSVPIRRFCEHAAACLFPWMALLFLPVAALAPRIYRWMQVADPGADHALRAKWPLFTPLGFYLVAVFCFGAWGLVSRQLRAWSLKQDQDGSAECTHKLRRWSAAGMFVFAPTLSLAAVMWMMALQHEWFSAVYGVYYFAESVWVTIAMVYFAAMVLKRAGILEAVLRDQQFYFLGTLLLAFTAFYAYIHFSQYFVIWNANLPEETSWYVLRQRGSWKYVGLVIIFGHFLLPLLALLRIDLKLKFWWMAPLCVWVWLMHYVELAFNIMPVNHPGGLSLQWVWLDFACMAFMAGLLIKVLARDFARHAPYPVKDPRLSEALGDCDDDGGTQ